MSSEILVPCVTTCGKVPSKNRYGRVNSEIKSVNESHAFKSKNGKFINSIKCKNSSEKVTAMGNSKGTCKSNRKLTYESDENTSGPSASGVEKTEIGERNSREQQ
ncbi:Hypothetical predicted protein, partial [Paramuricea clavata]